MSGFPNLEADSCTSDGIYAQHEIWRCDKPLGSLAGRAEPSCTAIPVSASRTIRSATSAVMSAEPTAVGITSTTSMPDELERARRARGTAQSRSALVIPPGSGVPVPGANAGSSTSTSTVRNTGPSPTIAIVALDDLADAEVADVVHEEARDAVLRLPAELLRPGQ